MILVAPRFIKLFTFKFVNAIALWPFIIVKDKKIRESTTILNHEKIHLRQQIELLILPFYFLYVLFYLYYRMTGYKHREAYLKIPFEREAYAQEQNLNYLQSRKFWNWKQFIR